MAIDSNQLFADEKNEGFCVFCGSKPSTRDHVPSRVLLDEPYPPDLPVVPACESCNASFCKDEQYVACLLECAISGSALPRVVGREKIGRIALRECPLPEHMLLCDTPDKAAEYWRLHVETNPYFNPECECFAVLILNTRRKVKGHQLLTMGTLDTILVHPREVFRGALIAGAAAVVLMHNHPSGEPEPSEADIKVTRDLIRAGQLLKIEVLDHVIMGKPGHRSLRELGYFL